MSAGRETMGDVERSQRRHALWIARAMSRTDLTPLRPEDLQRLGEACTVTTVEVGTVLLHAGQEINDVYAVRSGRLHLAVKRPVTGRQMVGIVGPGGVVGDIPVFCGLPMPFDALADVTTTVIRVSSDELVALLSRSPGLSLRWMRSVAMRMEQTQRRMITLLTKDLPAQVATVLLDQRHQEADGAWVVPLPHQTIAHLLGVRRQSVSRVVGRFRKDGLVASHYGRLELLDLDGLAAIAGEPLERLTCRPEDGTRVRAAG